MAKVILVLIDGLRYDIACKHMSYMASLTEKGLAARFMVKAEMPSLSKPLFETLLTGVPPYISGVTSNEFAGMSSQESLFHLTKRHGLVKAAAAYYWVSELYNAYPFDPPLHREQENEEMPIQFGRFYLRIPIRLSSFCRRRNPSKKIQTSFFADSPHGCRLLQPPLWRELKGVCCQNVRYGCAFKYLHILYDWISKEYGIWVAPNDGHMCTFLALVVVLGKGVSQDLIRFIKKGQSRAVICAWAKGLVRVKAVIGGFKRREVMVQQQRKSH